jgi:hypothetical protein
VILEMSVSKETTSKNRSKEEFYSMMESGGINKQSDLFTLVLNKNQYPQLMQDKSWNLAVPFVEQRFSHTPSESIANNFTPTATKLKIKNLQTARSIAPKESININLNYLHHCRSQNRDFLKFFKRSKSA